MKCPYCHGRYAFNTCPGGYDKHVRAIGEDTPDGEPVTYTTTMELAVSLDHEYGCPHCDVVGTQVQIVAHVKTDHVPRNLGDPRYGR
jgi:uncharacterized Zn-finger protein